MIKEFTTEEEAEQFRQELEKTFEPKWFCPLLRDWCRKDCVCYQHASKPRKIGGTWRVSEPYCNNAMFFEHWIEA